VSDHERARQPSAVMDEVTIARALATAVRHVPGVADISAGHLVEVATYGPAARVLGVAVQRGPGGWQIAVHVRAVYTATLDLRQLAARLRTTVREALARLGVEAIEAIDVAIDDLLVEEGTP